MNRKTWSAVDTTSSKACLPADPVLDAALKANSERGLPAIDVSPAQGKLLNLLVRMSGAKTDTRDRHARRLFDDLAGARAAARRQGRDA